MGLIELIGKLILVAIFSIVCLVIGASVLSSGVNIITGAVCFFIFLIWLSLMKFILG